MNCYFHRDRPATHTDAVVDLDNSTTETAYKRVGICRDCAYWRGQENTSRVEPLQPEKQPEEEPERPQ